MAKSAALRKTDTRPPNAAYLEQSLAWLGRASMDEALAFYRETYEAPGCDDWLLAELGKADLFFLLVHLLRRPDVAHPWLYARIREVEENPDGYLDLWAREHYKSTIITFGLTIQDILRDPEVTIGIFSHSRPIAKGFLRQIKVELETNENLKKLYPEVLWQDPKKHAPKWSEDDGIVVRRQGNAKESTVEAWGLVDGQPIGKHFRILLYDDVVVPASVTGPEMMAKTTGSLELSYSLGTEDGIKRGAGTRYHFNDSYRTVLERGTLKLRLYDGTEDNCGDIKRPVLLSPEKMAEKRRDMGIYTFACQILQNPRADSTHGFQRAWLEHWNPDAGKGLNIYLLRDPASKKKKTSDTTVDWVLGLGEDENYYILACYRDRLNLTERTKQLFDLHRKWKPIEVRYEEYGLQADIEHLQTEMDRQKYRFKITRVGGTMAKEDRIKRLLPLFENRRIILPTRFDITTSEHKTEDMVHEFVENEYMAFPVPVHDDMLDSLSRICDTVAVGGEKLSLKWPKKQAPRPHIPSYGVLDPVTGI
jgi:phage terminase large subunit-like protein